MGHQHHQHTPEPVAQMQHSPEQPVSQGAEHSHTSQIPDANPEIHLRKAHSKLSNFRGLSQELGSHLPQSSIPIQAKLEIRQPNDRYEQEADRVAEEVCDRVKISAEADRIHHPDASPFSPVQTQSLSPGSPLQRQTDRSQNQVTPLESTIQQARTGGESLPHPVRTSMERAFGTDFSGVKIHTDTQAHRLNRSLGARAFTSDRHIFFRSGDYHPTQPAGQKLLAHELTHVMQQTGASHPSVVQCDLTEAEKVEHRKKGFATLIHDIEDGTLTKQEVASLVSDEILSLDLADAMNLSWDKTKEAIGEPKTQAALKNPEFVRAMTPEQQFGLDVDQWMKTMFKSSNPEMTGILKRLFLVLRQGLYFGQGGEDLKGFDMPLAAALSHGGRINMVIDYEGWEHRHQFWNWVMTGKEQKHTRGGKERKAGVTTPGVALSTGVAGLSRRMGTHGVEYNKFGIPLEVSKTDTEGKKRLEGLLEEGENDRETIEIALEIAEWYETRLKDTKKATETAKEEIEDEFTSSTKGKVGRALLGIPTLGISEGIRAIHKKRLTKKAIKQEIAQEGVGKTFTFAEACNKVQMSRGDASNTRPALELLKEEGIATYADPLRPTTQINLKQYSTKSLGLGGYKKGKHFGINLPVGGEGELDVNGKQIEAKGDHGHMYIHYTSPKADEKQFGSLLIGIEGSAPAFFSGNLKGRSDPYGKAHDTKGTSGEFSPTGGQKWRFLKGKSPGLSAPAEYDGMIMRITDEIMVAAQTEYSALKALEAKPRLKQKAEEFMKNRLSQGSKVANKVTTKASLFDYLDE